MIHTSRIALTAVLIASPALAQNPPAAPAVTPPAGRAQTPAEPGRNTNPFPAPIPAREGVIKVNFVEFATLPDAGTQPPRMNLLRDEPATRRMFVNTMQGMLYTISYDGKSVQAYLDLNDPKWAHPVQAGGSERGFHSFAFHPQFAQPGTPGFGKIFYLNADALPTGGQNFHRILFNDKGDAKPLLQLVREKNSAQGKPPAMRADLRMGMGPNGQLFILNKRDGVIRLVVP